MRLVYDESNSGVVGPEPQKPEKASKAVKISQKIAYASGFQNDAFLLANEDQLLANISQVTQTYPNVQPYFDVAFNTCPWLLKTLEAMAFKFAANSKAEIQHLAGLGINPANISFAASVKVASAIKTATAFGVQFIAFDNFNELKKVKKVVKSGGAKLLLALEEDAAFTAFAGYPDREQPWLELLNEAKDLGLDVVGVSIGGKASGKGHFNKMMALAKMAFSVGQSMGHDMKIVDVGLMHDLDQGELDEAIDKHFRGLSYDLIGHLGSEFIENVFSCGAKVIGKRVGYEGQRSLIINDGIYNSFGRLMVDDNYNINDVKSLLPSNAPPTQSVVADIYGSSGDDIDVIVQDLELDHDVDENEWLFFPNMGAFSFSLSTHVNSCQLPSKFGNFWLFAPDTTANEEIENLDNLSSLDISMLLSEEDSLEVIFLDIEGNLSKEQQRCLDLFQELPDFWQDFLQR